MRHLGHPLTFVVLSSMALLACKPRTYSDSGVSQDGRPGASPGALEIPADLAAQSELQRTTERTYSLDRQGNAALGMVERYLSSKGFEVDLDSDFRSQMVVEEATQGASRTQNTYNVRCTIRLKPLASSGQGSQPITVEIRGAQLGQAVFDGNFREIARVTLGALERQFQADYSWLNERGYFPPEVAGRFQTAAAIADLATEATGRTAPTTLPTNWIDSTNEVRAIMRNLPPELNFKIAQLNSKLGQQAARDAEVRRIEPRNVMLDRAATLEGLEEIRRGLTNAEQIRALQTIIERVGGRR